MASDDNNICRHCLLFIFIVVSSFPMLRLKMNESVIKPELTSFHNMGIP